MRLRYCYKLCSLPKGLKHMDNLILLDISGCRSLTFIPGEIGELTCLTKLSIFIVGKDSGHRLQELKDVNLGGDLSIKMIEYVKSCTDAKSANLMQKNNLNRLSLSWSEGGGNDCNLTEEVLVGLKPHSNLKRLKLSHHRGLKFPDWMMDLTLPNLVEIELVSCNRCEQLPPFGKLKFLKNLRLYGMNNLKCIGYKMYGDGKISFPSLESLILEDMGSLEEWAMPIVDGGADLFPVLGRVSIRDCPKLVRFPIITSVKELKIANGSEMSIRLVENFTSVRKLEIQGYTELTYLPDGLLQNLTLLEDLCIHELRNLKSLRNQLDKLTSLQELRLHECRQLESLPYGLCSLSTLKMISVRGCRIESFPPINGFSGLSSLRQLCLQGCSELAFLSKGMENLTALENLFLEECPKLNSLPESIGNLTALQRLRISGCEKMSSLPNEIGFLSSLSKLEISCCPNLISLPELTRNLKMLRELIILSCPELERRCKKESGEDWPKIAYAPRKF